MTTIDQLMRAVETAQELRRLRFDEYGTPTSKLPHCPQCEEDELIASDFDCTAGCVRCGWTCAWARELDA